MQLEFPCRFSFSCLLHLFSFLLFKRCHCTGWQLCRSFCNSLPAASSGRRLTKPDTTLHPSAKACSVPTSRSSAQIAISNFTGGAGCSFKIPATTIWRPGRVVDAGKSEKSLSDIRPFAELAFRQSLMDFREHSLQRRTAERDAFADEKCSLRKWFLWRKKKRLYSRESSGILSLRRSGSRRLAEVKLCGSEFMNTFVAKGCCSDGNLLWRQRAHTF